MTEERSIRPVQFGIPGTSVLDFLSAFPDDLACARHIFAVRFANVACPKCGKQGPWRPINGYRTFGHPCGQHRAVSGKTALHRAKLSYWSTFYAMLLFCNFRGGAPSSFFMRHFGLSRPGAAALADRIRIQMALCEQSELIGGEGKYVEIGETIVRRIRTIGRKGPGSLRIVTASDGEKVRSCVIDRARRSRLLTFLNNAVDPRSIIVTRYERTHAHFSDYGRLLTTVVFAGGEIECAKVSNLIEPFWMRLKQSLRSSYAHQHRDEFWKYLKEFEFRYNHRRKPENMFWDLVGAFPAADPAALARCRRLAELTAATEAIME